MPARRRTSDQSGFGWTKRWYMVEEIVDQWYGSDDAFFKVRTDDGNLYILRRNMSADEWHLESFRSVKD